MKALTEYPWPGNVRELENTINRLIVLAGGDKITMADLEGSQIAVSPSSIASLAENGHDYTQINVQIKSIDELEKDEILKAIRRNGGNFSAAAKELGMSRSTLYRKTDKYQL